MRRLVLLRGLRRATVQTLLPVTLTVLLFVATLFLFLRPSLEAQMQAQKREQVRVLTQLACSLLADYQARVDAGELTLADAQERAKQRIRRFRFGEDDKDYFWVIDREPRMLVHPYRPELEGTNVADYRDPEGTRLFSEMVAEVKRAGSGYVTYLWQYKDNPDRVLPKLSYVQGFEPWGWVVGCGVYLDDLAHEMEVIAGRMRFMSLGVLAVMVLLCAWGGAVIVRSESRRLRAEAELRENEERLRAILDHAAEIIYTADAEGRLLFVSSACERLLGYAPAELVNRNILDLVHPDDAPRCREALARLFETGETQGVEVRARHRDGSWRVHLSTGAMARDGAGGVRYCVGLSQDVTRQRRAEQEARIQREQLVQAEKMASLGILIAGVAHEINNPNFAVMSNADTLAGIWEPLRDTLDRYTAEHGDFPVGGLGYADVREQVPMLISGVIDASERIKHIVNELRDYARHEPADRHEPVDVNDAVRAAVTLVGSLIKRSTSRFSVNLAMNLPAVNGNRRRLEQVVVNLLQNACQALPGPDRGIFVSTHFDPARRLVVIAVHDEGNGIHQQDLAHLTDPFFTTKRDTGGTGLGLSISAAIVEEHQGSLSFESTPGQGATIRVQLPAAPDA